MARVTFATLASLGAVAALVATAPSCTSDRATATTATTAASRELERVRASFPSARLESAPFDGESRPLRVTLPARSDDPLAIEDRASGVAVRVRLEGARASTREDVDGVAVYPGAGVFVREGPAGVEDWVLYASRPDVEEARYVLDVTRVAGLRLVGGELEALDASGAPRVVALPPFVIGASGARYAATLAVEACAVDASPAAPWGRPVTPPGAEACVLRVRWSAGQDYPALLDPSWISGDMGRERDDHTAVKLADGRVLLVFGQTCPQCVLQSVAQLFDPATKTFASTGTPPDRGRGRPGVLLADGRVLVIGVGGLLFDPSTGQWSDTGAMTAVRDGTTATRLSSGRVLVAGGAGASAELYDPTTNTFTATAAMTAARTRPAASLLADGRVLLTGGGDASAEVYDPAAGSTGSFTAVGSMSVSRTGHASVTLAGGKVLVVGGGVAEAELFDPATGTFSPTGRMVDPREELEATVAPSGNVFVTGGFVRDLATRAVEIYVPGTGQFVVGPVMSTGRGAHRAVRLDTGAIMVTGGRNHAESLFSGTTGSYELLDVAAPGAPCESDDDCASGQCDFGVCCQASCTGACRACAPGTGACVVVADADDLDTCTGPMTCSGSGACAKKNGQACTAGSECASGFCVDGVCCDQACSGACEACDGLVKGRCEAVAGPPHGARPCATDGTVCGGSCDGVHRDACRYPSDQTGCGTSCSDGLRTARACDGRGACAEVTTRACPGNYACADESACKTSCTENADCARSYRCEGGKCVPTATCDGDHTIASPDGESSTDCAPYRCDADDRCKTSCQSVDDCAEPFVCSAAGECVAAASVALSSACAAAPVRAGGSRALEALLAVVGLSLLARRRLSRERDEP